MAGGLSSSSSLTPFTGKRLSMASVRKPEESMSQGKFLFGMVVCFVVAIAALSLIAPDSTSGVARTLAGAVSRLVAGETAGRQALVGSVWWGVLPMLMAGTLRIRN